MKKVAVSLKALNRLPFAQVPQGHQLQGQSCRSLIKVGIHPNRHSSQ